jgi:hypothetical protein
LKVLTLAACSLLWVATLVIATPCIAQQQLDNASITKMSEAGLGDGTIVQMIAAQPGAYLVTPDALIALKKAGVSDAVIHALVAKATGAPVQPMAVPPSEMEEQGAFANLDMGVYDKVSGNWTLLNSERVNWKTGGVLKSVFSDGVVKMDINGRLSGADSTTTVESPLQFLIKGEGGIQAGDFQLVHLHVKKDAREFRTVTGGVFHASGGASRDAVDFQTKEIGRHAWMVTFAAPLAPGEYAFLVPGYAASTTSGSTGKAYTFHVTQ